MDIVLLEVFALEQWVRRCEALVRVFEEGATFKLPGDSTKETWEVFQHKGRHEDFGHLVHETTPGKGWLLDADLLVGCENGVAATQFRRGPENPQAYHGTCGKRINIEVAL